MDIRKLAELLAEARVRVKATDRAYEASVDVLREAVVLQDQAVQTLTLTRENVAEARKALRKALRSAAACDMLAELVDQSKEY